MLEAGRDVRGALLDEGELGRAEFRPIVARKMDPGGQLGDEGLARRQPAVLEEGTKRRLRRPAEVLEVHDQRRRAEARVGLEPRGQVAMDVAPVARPTFDLRAAAPEMLRFVRSPPDRRR